MGVNINPLPNFANKKILPAAFDDSLSYYELNAKVLSKTNETVEQVNANTVKVDNMINFLQTPHYKGAWNPSMGYAVFDVALYDDGNTYTCIKPTNPGILPTDTEYWALTGYSGALAVELLKYCKSYETVAAMKADPLLAPETVCHTNGFRTAGDGGGAFYYVGAAGYANEMDVIKTVNGYAKFVRMGDVTPEMLGAFADGATDDSPYIGRVLELYNIVNLNDKTYYLNSDITLASGAAIIGRGSRLTTVKTNGVSFVGQSYVTVHGVKFVSDTSTRRGVCFTGLHTYIQISDCAMTGYETAIEFAAGDWNGFVSITDCAIEYCTVGILNNATRFNFVQIESTRFQHVKYAIEAERLESVIVIGCDFELGEPDGFAIYSPRGAVECYGVDLVGLYYEFNAPLCNAVRAGSLTIRNSWLLLTGVMLINDERNDADSVLFVTIDGCYAYTAPGAKIMKAPNFYKVKLNSTIVNTSAGAHAIGKNDITGTCVVLNYDTLSGMALNALNVATDIVASNSIKANILNGSSGTQNIMGAWSGTGNAQYPVFKKFNSAGDMEANKPVYNTDMALAITDNKLYRFDSSTSNWVQITM